MKKNVSIYVMGGYNYNEKHGYYKAVLVYKNRYKTIQKEYGNETIDNKQITVNRAMLYGIIDSMKSLKGSCNVNVFTLVPLGFKDSSKCVNSDLIDRILKIAESNNHDFKITWGNAEKVRKFIESRMLDI